MAGLRDEFLVLLRAPVAPWIWFVSSVLTVVAGPFGTYDSMALPIRVLFWPSTIAVALVVAYGLCAMLFALAPKLNHWLHDGIISVLFSLLFTPVVSIALTMSTSNTLPFPNLLIEVFSITACIALLQRVIKINWPSMANADQPAVVEEPAEPRLLRRLEGVTAKDILRMTVQDHYVEVVMLGKPSQRILMRFGDAVEEAEELDGFCVHRSHWVVRSSILGVVTENGREMVEMIDGSRVPVSRTYRPNLIAAGLISAEKKQVAG
ncbi:LytTR family DNA-binding domain-containing protein [Flavimaricola marinus]|uniref:LytTr DNA-binding domain protein n=1 Tax=Flavimaricola marinus TaxID=1819565 RepID=A0A238LAM6_9RHOB|nr:LytTR family DNA-binding domain-containing protein [Flavimaricola marinus]SMY06603.1 LytTr DNA-binding domain protein [Flavimaricola marinus]